MDTKKQNAWFVRVGPFGGLFPSTIKGAFFTIIVIAPLAWAMAYGAKLADADKKQIKGILDLFG